MKINILALAVIISVSATAHGQYIADPYLYYSVGGGRATTPTIIDPSVSFGFRASSSGFACGNFDPKLDIRSMLGGVGNSMADLGSLKSSLTGALPGQILCRAQPSLCQLMQHYTVRAEDQWRFSIDACELLQQKSADGPNAGSDWQALGKAQTWQRLAQDGASDAVTIQQQVSEETDPCVTWVEGKEAGCPGKPPIKPVRDAVRAGWCASNSLPADCDTTITPKTTDRSAASTWSSPKDAAEFTADIVGDSEIKDGGTPSSHVASGLQPKVDEEKVEVLETLQQVLASGKFPDQAQAEKLHAPSVAVNFSADPGIARSGPARNLCRTPGRGDRPGPRGRKSPAVAQAFTHRRNRTKHPEFWPRERGVDHCGRPPRAGNRPDHLRLSNASLTGVGYGRSASRSVRENKVAHSRPQRNLSNHPITVGNRHGNRILS